jgi:hypothetical protein
MRTLALVLTVVLLNDLALLVVLDASVPAWGLVLGGVAALTLPILAVVTVAVDEPEQPTIEDLQADVEALRERIEQLETAE